MSLTTIFKNNINSQKNKNLVLGNSIINKETNIKNKGTGAGGANTNKNGLNYEKSTELSTCYKIKQIHKNCKELVFNINNDIPFIATNGISLFKYMDQHMDKSISGAHGCKRPDECFINENTKQIFIIEKKFQQTKGSTCEKIQTPDFKIWQYSRIFPDYNIIYIYCLSDWFKKNCIAELEYLNFKGISYFWGNDKTYKEELIDFIINYK